MVDWNKPIQWRFSLKQLFAVVTINALAFSAFVSELPSEWKILALCAPVVSAGVAALILGAAIAGPTRVASIRRSPGLFALQLLGQIVMSLGFGLIAGAAVIALTVTLHLTAYYALRLAA